MTKKFEFPIDELKYYLTLQLEAHLSNNREVYQDLERKILALERQL